MTLPLHPDARRCPGLRGHARTDDPGTPTSRPSPLTILVVEDDPRLRRMQRLLLQWAGHQVREAEHGHAALAAVDESLPDLVITELAMPVMAGAELIRRLRADPATALIPIVAMTSDGLRAATGADAVLFKPYQPDDLLAAATTLLDRSSARRLALLRRRAPALKPAHKPVWKPSGRRRAVSGYHHW